MPKQRKIVMVGLLAALAVFAAFGAISVVLPDGIDGQQAHGMRTDSGETCTDLGACCGFVDYDGYCTGV